MIPVRPIRTPVSSRSVPGAGEGRNRHAWVRSDVCRRLFLGLASSLSLLGAVIPVHADRPVWVESIELYPVGQTDPFTNELHRLQILRLTNAERAQVEAISPGSNPDEYFLADRFTECYESLQLKFDRHEYEERSRFKFETDFEPHDVSSLAPQGNNRTYSIHIDRYADKNWEGRYAGAILLVPGTGSYGGNYLMFGMAMSVLKGYIVYVVDAPSHGRSHLHKLIAKDPESKGTGVFLERAVSQDGRWVFENALEPGWVEVGDTDFSLEQIVTCIQAIGRRIVKREEANLKHLNDAYRALEPERRDVGWFGKPVEEMTHLTLMGTSQGGETAFWSADPRTTGQGRTGAYSVFFPFDSVICHNIYNSAFDAPQTKMRLLRSGLGAPIVATVLDGKDSLWANGDWTQYYEGNSLFFRAADRWVRWRYNMSDYRDLLKFGEKYRDFIPNTEIPVLVAIAQNDLLYSSDGHARKLVKKLFQSIGRPTSDTLWHLEFKTPPGRLGHQLLVNFTFDFIEAADAWIKYRAGGPGSNFEYDPDLWSRIE